MRHDVVRRVQALALIVVGDQRDGPVVLVAHHAAGEVLARQLAALKIERVAVAVVRRHAEDRDAAVVLEPAHLPVVGNVAPDEITSLPAPRRPLRPQRARPQPLDRRVDLAKAVEGWIDREHVRIGEVHVGRRVRPEIPRRRRDDGRRLDGLRLGQREAWREGHRAGGLEQRATGQESGGGHRRPPVREALQRPPTLISLSRPRCGARTSTAAARSEGTGPARRPPSGADR